MAEPPNAPDPPLAALARTSSLIFRGMVQQVAASNVDGLAAAANLELVRVDVPLRSDPALGDLTGMLVTVAMDASTPLAAGTEAIFFTTGWIHGEQIAVREVAHVAPDLVEAVATQIARLPDLHLISRLAQARLVVLAEVQSTSRLDHTRERRSPRWARAELRVVTALKGRSRSPVLYFPTSDSHHWYRAKRPRKGQRRIFILHAEDSQAGRWLSDEERGAVFTALDPADIQPASQLDRIRALLREARS
jgi:hypothetical protein